MEQTKERNIAERIIPNIYKKSSSAPQIVVTGGAGYLGSILVPMLIDLGYRVQVIDRFYFGRAHFMHLEEHPSLKIIDLDIFHHENIPDIFKDVQTVIHLASISNDPSGDLDPNLTIQTNFLATMSLARRAKAEGVKQFIFASSCSVYGASGEAFLDEQSPVGPVTLYALSKLQCETELLPMADHRFAVTLLRFSTLFGYSPRMRFDLAVNVMAKRALQGKSLLLHGDGLQYRPFIHVKDAARAILQVMKSDPALTNRQIFNVGNEKLNFMIKDLVEKVHARFPAVQIEPVPFNKDSRSYRVRFYKFEKMCDFQPNYLIEDALQEIEKSYKEGPLQNMDNENYYNVEVMKKLLKEPVMTYSLASTPRWSTNISNNK